jgi:MFS family permease
MHSLIAHEDPCPRFLTLPPSGLHPPPSPTQSACFGCIGTALPPALRASGLEPAAVAILLGKLGSASAFFEVLLSSSFGKLADAIGRKPILVMAPALTVLARLLVVASPTLPVLIGVRFLTTLVVPIYWLAFQATMADCYARDATKLAVIGSRVQAGLGLGYAVSVLLGGWLAATDIRYAYAASCALGCCVLSCHVFFLPETLPAHRRVPFRWQGSSPLAFLRLFRRGALSFKLNTVVVLQSLTNGMGDLWQVLSSSHTLASARARARALSLSLSPLHVRMYTIDLFRLRKTVFDKNVFINPSGLRALVKKFKGGVF